MDIVKLLGSENLLVRAILQCERGMINSFSSNEKKLAIDAGIKDSHSADKLQLRKYHGEAFNLVFEADLPEDHDDYWCAELLIGENVEEEQQIPISVFNKTSNPINAGKLMFFGLELNVIGGRTSCTLFQLRDQLVKPKVSFALPQARGIRGHLKLW